AFNYINALRRASLIADLTSDAAQSSLRIVAVVREECEVPIVLGERAAFFRILHRDQAVLLEITSNEVPDCNSHPFQYSQADHRSTSPITISTLPRITITSATVWPRQRSSKTVRLIKLGGRTR